jgi:hypothetical protein
LGLGVCAFADLSAEERFGFEKLSGHFAGIQLENLLCYSAWVYVARHNSGAVAYSQIENFDSEDINADDVNMEAIEHLANRGLQGHDKDEVERLFMEARIAAMARVQEAARKRAKGPVRRSNRVIFFTVILVTSLVPLLRLVAVWLSGFSTTWYIVSTAGFGLLILMIYGLITHR